MALTVDRFLGLGFLLLGLVVGLGLIFVKPAPGEPERLSKFLPGMSLYRFATFRYCVSAIGFLFALLGAAIVLGRVTLG
jgi:hypothetical protein